MDAIAEIEENLFTGCSKVFTYMRDVQKHEDFYAFGLFVCGSFTYITPAANTIRGYRQALKSFPNRRSYPKTTFRYSPMEWQHLGTDEDGAGSEFNNIYRLLSDYIWENDEEMRSQRMASVFVVMFRTLERLNREKLVFRFNGWIPLLVCSEFDGNDEILELTSFQYFLSQDAFKGVKFEYQKDADHWNMLMQELRWCYPNSTIAHVRNALKLPNHF